MAWAETPVTTSSPSTAPSRDRFHALLLNGGGRPESNYQTHLLHVRELYRLLTSNGVRPDHISVLSSDGSDPKPDLATRSPAGDTGETWLLAGTALGEQLVSGVDYVSSELPGVTLMPATRQGVRRWLESARARLGPGDVLLLFVTDHGEQPTSDPLDNRIVLWNDQWLTVRELRAALGRFRAGVRVVALMSQCYSGGFGHLVSAHRIDGEPSGAVCGYYAAPADRPAYGCFAENRGKDNVGHAFHFLRALAASGQLDAAHDDVVVSDITPDVPLRSSDLYLAELLTRVAQKERRRLDALADELLDEVAGPDEATPERLLLDRLAQSFGLASPRRLTDLAHAYQRLVALDDELNTFSQLWNETFGEAVSENWSRFAATHPAWARRLSDIERRSEVRPAQARELGAALHAELAQFAADGYEELRQLYDKAEEAEALSYRNQVREGVFLRMRALLLRRAGLHYVQTRGRPAERHALAALQACEQLSLPQRPSPVSTSEASPEEATFPSLATDRARIAALRPGWLGMTYGAPEPSQRRRYRLGAGPVRIKAVAAHSPAQAAGLSAGDIVLGTPTRPFSDPQALRRLAMLAKAGRPQPLALLRNGKRLTVSLTAAAYPSTAAADVFTGDDDAPADDHASAGSKSSDGQAGHSR